MRRIASEIHSQAEIKQIVTIVRNLVITRKQCQFLKIHREDFSV